MHRRSLVFLIFKFFPFDQVPKTFTPNVAKYQASCLVVITRHNSYVYGRTVRISVTFHFTICIFLLLSQGFSQIKGFCLTIFVIIENEISKNRQNKKIQEDEN